MLSVLVFISCEDCEVIELTESVTTCENNILLIRQAIDDDGVSNSYFDSIPVPLQLPVNYQNIRFDANESLFPEFVKPANYDAYNPTTQQYFIEYPQQQILFKYDVSTGTRDQFVAGLYAAPIVYNNTLYALQFEETTDGFPGTTVNYNIVSIDQNTGGLSTVFSGSFIRESPFNIESLSSAKDDGGNIYFLGFSNLLKYDVDSSTSEYFELTPEWDNIDNRTRFSGLEYRNNGNLVAIKRFSNTSIDETVLTEFSTTDPTNTQEDLINLEEVQINFNPEFYSTTYEKCDDSYYMTYRDSHIFSVNLENLSVTGDVNQPYLLGLAATNQ